MTARWFEKFTGSIEEKRRYKRYKARVEHLPTGYRTAINAIERYLTYFGGVTKGDVLVRMFDDLLDLFEQSASDGTSVRAIVGEDPVEFVEAFLANYAEGRWINTERDRLLDAIERAEQSDPGTSDSHQS
jgi:DNA-binding ferritin-like protein (Dps family)